jgi:hypothetical protein
MKSMSTFLEQLSPEEAKSILRILSAEDPNIANRIHKLAKKRLSKVDEKEVENEVYRKLLSLQVEDIVSRSGSKRFGYVEPVEAAYEVVEEALEPFANQLMKYRKLAMFPEMSKVGMGLAKGIIKFTKAGKTEFKEWAPDDAIEWLHGLLIEWEKDCKDSHEKDFIYRINQLLEGNASH